ncbi:serine/threonine protein kinase [Streptomyces sp. M10(2022)]
MLILLGMAAAVVYALMFMPKGGSDADTGTGAGSTPSGSGAPAEPQPDASASPPSGEESAESGSQKPQTSRSGVALARAMCCARTRRASSSVCSGLASQPANADRQIRYGSDGFSVLIVPGRDTVKANGGDPLEYQSGKEPELQPFRDSSWSSSTGLRRVDVGRQAMAEGQFTWQENSGREVYVRNLAMIVDGRYHIIQVIGPSSERDKVTDIYEQAVATYRVSS